MVTAQKLKHVTLDSLVSAELGNTYGAVLTAAKRGAALTPNRRLVSDGHKGRGCERSCRGRRIESLPEPLAGDARSYPLRTQVCGFFDRPPATPRGTQGRERKVVNCRR